MSREEVGARTKCHRYACMNGCLQFARFGIGTAFAALPACTSTGASSWPACACSHVACYCANMSGLILQNFAMRIVEICAHRQTDITFLVVHHFSLHTCVFTIGCNVAFALHAITISPISVWTRE